MRIPSSCWSTALTSSEGHIRDLPDHVRSNVVATEETQARGKEVGVPLVPVYFTEVELAALNEFFNGDGTMEDTIYDPLGRKLLIAAAKAGLLEGEQ